MSEHEPELWQLTLEGTREAVHAISDVLENQPEPEHVSASLFGDVGPWTLQVVYDCKPGAQQVEKLTGHADITFTDLENLENKNWVLESLRDLKPVKAGRFFVHGHHGVSGGSDMVSICIPAGMAFGTGHHETTSGCLLELDRLLGKGHQFENVLDLGTGSGLLAIAASKILHAHVTASDIDDVAVAVARENALFNKSPDIGFLAADGMDDPVFRGKTYDLIFANILAAPLIELSESIMAHLASGGRLILSGLLTRQAEKVLAAYETHGAECLHSRVIGEWTILHLART